CHRVHRIRQVLPNACDALDLGLTAELSFRSDFTGHAGDFRGEAVELVDHRIDGVLQLEDFAAHINGDLRREVAAGYGCGHLRDVTNLRGEVAGHRVYGVREVFPGSGDAPDLCLS